LTLKTVDVMAVGRSDDGVEKQKKQNNDEKNEEEVVE
jgi:hypothetical protein